MTIRTEKAFPCVLVSMNTFDLTAFEHHHKPQDLAKRWGVSPNRIRIWSQNEPGVLFIERPQKRRNRRYVTIQIPASVAERFYNGHVPKDSPPPAVE